jgi:Fe-S-cluster-containing dehydrogenase component
MNNQPKWAMLIDTTKCVGCHSCRVACQNQNGLDVKESFNRIEEQEFGVFPDFNRRFTPAQCQHCDNPPCIRVCPTGASYKRSDGIVSIDTNKCIGCKYCMVACPYNARVINIKEGYIHKCGFCLELIEDGQAPACVSTCPMGVRVFGDINDPESVISKMLISKKTHRLGESLDTKPSIYYITRK